MNPLIVRPGLLQGNNLNTRVAKLVVHQGPGLAEFPSDAQMSEVDHLWFRHLQAVSLSIIGHHVQDASLPDGSRVRIESNSGLHTIEVWAVAPRGGIQFPPLWVLINVNKAYNTPFSFYSEEMRSYLYRLPDDLNAAGAELVYSGATTTELTYTPDTGIKYTYNTDVTEEGEYGCITTFAPYNGHAAYVFSRANYSTFNPQPVPNTTTVYSIVLNGVRVDYTVYPTSDGIYAGTMLHHMVRSLDVNQLNFATRSAASNGNSAPGTEVYRKYTVSSSPSVAIDPSGSSPPAVLTPIGGQYAQRGVGRMYQTTKHIFDYPAGNAVRRYDRGYNLIDTSATADSIPYTNNLVISFADDFKAGIYNYSGGKVAQINLAKLPQLQDDALFASYTLSQYAVVSPDDLTAAYLSTHFAAPRYLGARGLAWTDASDGAAAWDRAYVSATFIPDLYYHWDKT